MLLLPPLSPFIFLVYYPLLHHTPTPAFCNGCLNEKKTLLSLFLLPFYRSVYEYVYLCARTSSLDFFVHTHGDVVVSVWFYVLYSPSPPTHSPIPTPLPSPLLFTDLTQLRVFVVLGAPSFLSLRTVFVSFCVSSLSLFLFFFALVWVSILAPSFGFELSFGTGVCLLACCRCSACGTFLFIGFYSVSTTPSLLLFYGDFGCAEACPLLRFLAASPTCLFLHLYIYLHT